MSDLSHLELLSNRTADRSSWVYGHAGEEDRRVLDRDAAHTMHQANCRPALLAIRSAKGIHVEDHSGRRYIDLHGNNCHHIGYLHPTLVTALTEQLSVLSCNNRGFTNGVFAQFAERLAGLWPGRDGRVFMVPGGAAANELALTIARVHTGRYKSITFDDSYHGRSFGAVSLTGAAVHRSPRLGPLLPGAMHVPSFRPRADSHDNVETAAQTSLAAIQEMMDAEGDIACVLAEPMANDCHRPPDWYWSTVRDLCDQHGALLIFDEVPTGLGKMGALFNNTLFDIRPDMTVLGKALGGAVLPVAVVVADGALDSSPELNLGYYTHEKNPLMARAALETLNIITGDGLVANARDCGSFALASLEEIRQRHDRVIPQPARGQGLMLSFDVSVEGQDSSINERLASSIFYRCMENGVILNYPARGTNITLSFPLIATKRDVSHVCQVLDEVLDGFSK